MEQARAQAQDTSTAPGVSPAAVSLYCYRAAARSLSLRLLTLELLAVAAGAPGSLLAHRREELDAESGIIERAMEASGKGARENLPDGGSSIVGAVAICRYLCQSATEHAVLKATRLTAASTKESASAREDGAGEGPSASAFPSPLKAARSAQAVLMLREEAIRRAQAAAAASSTTSGILGLGVAATPRQQAAGMSRLRIDVNQDAMASDVDVAQPLQMAFARAVVECLSVVHAPEAESSMGDAAATIGLRLAAFRRMHDAGTSVRKCAGGLAGWLGADRVAEALAVVGRGMTGSGGFAPPGASLVASLANARRLGVPPTAALVAAAEDARDRGSNAISNGGQGDTGAGSSSGWVESSDGVANELDASASPYGDSFLFDVEAAAARLGLRRQWRALRQRRSARWSMDTARAVVLLRRASRSLQVARAGASPVKKRWGHGARPVARAGSARSMKSGTGDEIALPGYERVVFGGTRTLPEEDEAQLVQDFLVQTAAGWGPLPEGNQAACGVREAAESQRLARGAARRREGAGASPFHLESGRSRGRMAIAGGGQMREGEGGEDEEELQLPDDLAMLVPAVAAAHEAAEDERDSLQALWAIAGFNCVASISEVQLDLCCSWRAFLETTMGFSLPDTNQARSCLNALSVYDRNLPMYNLSQKTPYHVALALVYRLRTANLGDSVVL